MENARKLADCYFYYYSTCTKGEACNFRHEPEALGCESMCFYWQQGKCFDQHCKLRHMELRKNRKQIPCYWETQPGGCRKKHCPFMHKSPQPRLDGLPPQPGSSLVTGRETQQQGVNRETGEGPPIGSGGVPNLHQNTAQPIPSPNTQTSHPANWQRQVTMEPTMMRGAALDGQHGGMPPLASINPITPMAPINSMTPLAAAYSALQPVDSLVVNFEEESDSESVSSVCLFKSNLDDSKHCMDILRLEEIQEETAAYYSYDFSKTSIEVFPSASADTIVSSVEAKFTGRKLPVEYESLSLDEIHGLKGGVKTNSSDDFKVLTLEEIRERKRKRMLRSNDTSSVETFTNVAENNNSPTHLNDEHINTALSNEGPDRTKLKRKYYADSTSDEHIETFLNVDLGKIKKYNLDDTSALDNNQHNMNFMSSVSQEEFNSIDIHEGSSALQRITTDVHLSNSVPDLVKCCTRQV